MQSVSVHSNEILKKICSKFYKFHICTNFEIHANLKRFCTIPKSETAKLRYHQIDNIMFQHVVSAIFETVKVHLGFHCALV